MSFYLKLQIQTNKKRGYRILKVHPVSSFALAFPVYMRLEVNNDYFASQPFTTECTALTKTKFRIVAERLLLSYDLDVSIQLLGWIVLINFISILDTRLCLTFSIVLQSG